jgi:16S rRNA pseudouridine516 synthase
MRWSQVLFSQGFGSRRECAALLAAGLVRHAGMVIDDG